MNLNSHKITSEGLEYVAVKDTILPEHVLSPVTALWFWTLHTTSTLKAVFEKGKPESTCKGQFLWVNMDP